MYSILKSTVMSGLLALTFSSGAGAFTLAGHIDGLPDSLRVELVDTEVPGRERVVLADTCCRGGDFVLSADVAATHLCKLSFNAYVPMFGSYVSALSLRVFAEPSADLKISTGLAYDSLRNVSVPERLVTVNGSPANAEFAQYLAEAGEAEAQANAAASLVGRKWLETMNDPDTMAVYEPLQKAADAVLAEAQRKYIAAHPGHAYASWLTLQELGKSFAYTADEIRAMAGAVQACPDTARIAAVNRARDFALRYALNIERPDFRISDPDKNKHDFAAVAAPGKYTFVDFWASWCGPCRNAIPHVRELAAQYGDRLNVCSISLDTDESAWRKAMDEEKMEWPQYFLDGNEEMYAAARAFNITTIPRLVLIDDKGRVVCSTNLPKEISEFLENNLGK